MLILAGLALLALVPAGLIPSLPILACPAGTCSCWHDPTCTQLILPGMVPLLLAWFCWY